MLDRTSRSATEVGTDHPYGMLPMKVRRYSPSDRDAAILPIGRDDDTVAETPVTESKSHPSERTRGPRPLRRAEPALPVVPAASIARDEAKAPIAASVPGPGMTGPSVDLPRVSDERAAAPSDLAEPAGPLLADEPDEVLLPKRGKRPLIFGVLGLLSVVGLYLGAQGLTSGQSPAEQTRSSLPFQPGTAPMAPTPRPGSVEMPPGVIMNVPMGATTSGAGTSGANGALSNTGEGNSARDLIAPSAGPEALSSRQSALMPDAMVPRQQPEPVISGPVSTRIAQLTCEGHQPILLSVAIYNDARIFDRAVPGLKDWTGRQNGVVLFDTRLRPDAVRLADAARSQNLIVMSYSDPDTRVEKIDDESAMSWFVFSQVDAGAVAGRNCVVRLFVR